MVYIGPLKLMLFIYLKPGLLATHVTPVLKRLGQDFKFKVTVYRTSRPCLKNTKEMKAQVLNTS